MTRSQMLYRLSCERWCRNSLRHAKPRLCGAAVSQALKVASRAGAAACARR